MNFIKRLFFEGYWECYYRKTPNSILDYPNLANQWHKIYTDRRFWCADPFLVNHNGEEYVFVEMMDRKKSYGVLGCGKITDGEKTEVRVIEDLECHTSYPHIFSWNNELYMIPETVERHTIELYKCKSFPDIWEKVSVLLSNINAADTTVFEYQGKLYAFIYEENEGANRLSIGKLNLINNRIENLCLVKQYDQKIGRPAGHVICKNGLYYRPTQYGVNFYGEKVIFQQFNIREIDGRIIYREKSDVELCTDNIGFNNSSQFMGTHTYNFDSGYEVMDFCKKKFYIERPLQLVMKKFKIGGYNFHG